MKFPRTPASSLQRHEETQEVLDRATRPTQVGGIRSRVQLKKHPKTDELELYALNRLSGTRLNRVKKHLRTCVACRERLVALSDFANAVKSAFLSNPDLLH
jgi:Putative zinc-finger